MKRILAFILLIAMICSLCVFAPSAAALSEEEEALYEKYAELIGQLEAGDFDAVIEAVQAMKPELEYEEVVITAENFYDYYEAATSDPYLNLDSAGAIVYIWPGNLVFRLKDEYVSRTDMKNSSVTVGATAKITLRRAKIDWETGEITLGDEIESKVRKELKKIGLFDPKVDQTRTGIAILTLDGTGFCYKHPKTGNWWSGSAEASLKKAKFYMPVYGDIELVRAEGSLFIAK